MNVKGEELQIRGVSIYLPPLRQGHIDEGYFVLRESSITQVYFNQSAKRWHVQFKLNGSTYDGELMRTLSSVPRFFVAGFLWTGTPANYMIVNG